MLFSILNQRRPPVKDLTKLEQLGRWSKMTECLLQKLSKEMLDGEFILKEGPLGGLENRETVRLGL